MSSQNQDKLYQLDKQLKETTEILKQNVDVCIHRGEQLDELETRTEELETNALKFKKLSRTLKQRYCCKNVKATLCIIFLILVFIGILIGLGCSATKKC